MFYAKFVELCAKKGTTRTKACVECGISRTAWHKWEKGGVPNGTTLNKIAAYFGVTTSELLGEEIKKDPAQSAESMTDGFISLYASLTPEQQAKVEAFAKFLQMEGKE